MSADTDTIGASPEQARALAALLDEIIPPSADGRLPGAGALGLATALAEALGRRPELRPLLADGLAALDELARGRGAPDFAGLARGRRRELLDALAARRQGFLPLLVGHALAAYYQHPHVLAVLGLEGRPPHPKGYSVEATDFDALLGPVRARSAFYRRP